MVRGSNSAVSLRYVSAAEQQGALCVNLEKEGRGILLNNHVEQEKRELLSGIQVFRLPCFGLECDEWRNTDEGESRHHYFGGERVLHNDPNVLSFDTDMNVVGCLWVMGGRGISEG